MNKNHFLKKGITVLVITLPSIEIMNCYQKRNTNVMSISFLTLYSINLRGLFYLNYYNFNSVEIPKILQTTVNKIIGIPELWDNFGTLILAFAIAFAVTLLIGYVKIKLKEL